ncbi:hypothetical protein CcrBL47_gp413 [Caulobacter phage BL47]|nr:hypothetical protein CcrBL47_gp413 [Caulobacter phage BL47]
MTLRLSKLKPSLWNGNGFGYSAAMWTLADHPGWIITKVYDWEAQHEDGRRVSAFTRKELLEKLTPIVEGSPQ